MPTNTRSSSNANKSKCMYYSLVLNSHYNNTSQLPQFTVAGSCIEYIENWPHLGHMHALTNDMNVRHRHEASFRQIDDVLCYFDKLDSIVELKLLYSFCSGFYGCQLWNL